MSRIIISEFMDGRAVESLRARFEVEYDPALVDRSEELLRKLPAAQALIVRNCTRVDAALLEHARILKVVGRLGVGLDNIDVEACAARSIAVIPATGANAHAVAEYVITTAMMLLRGVYLNSADVLTGRWPRAKLSNGRELAGKTIGLVGFGSTGRITGRLARALDMRAIAYDPNIAASDPVWTAESTTPRPLDVLLMNADVVSLHIPLTPATRNLFDAEQLARMKPDAVLVNPSRGGIVDEAAVAAQLRAGRLAGAALDVFAEEPLPAESPLVGVPNLILTPHVAGITRESNQRVSRMIADLVASALEEPGSERKTP